MQRRNKDESASVSRLAARVLCAAASLLIILCFSHPALSADDTVAAPQLSWQSRVQGEQEKVVGDLARSSQVDTGSQALKMLEGLGYCLAVFLIGLHLFKRFHVRAAASNKRAMRLIETLNLSSKNQIHLVEVDNQRILIASGQSNLSFLRVGQPEEFSVEAFNEESELQLEAAPTAGPHREAIC
ncbi:MAG: FliO/MopB family protein [Deltaproteobacteria bacterium]|nr:FliO/MopB family protein [Deltaproteobacteria bacterium]